MILDNRKKYTWKPEKEPQSVGLETSGIGIS